jgi:hypothetical protein
MGKHGICYWARDCRLKGVEKFFIKINRFYESIEKRLENYAIMQLLYFSSKESLPGINLAKRSPKPFVYKQ